MNKGWIYYTYSKILIHPKKENVMKKFEKSVKEYNEITCRNFESAIVFFVISYAITKIFVNVIYKIMGKEE